jgi:inosine-uridine nucleoside N-ribohydrolase
MSNVPERRKGLRRLLVDTDTAADDPVALVMALRHPGVRVEAITIVAGNVPVDRGVQNALYTLELLEEVVPCSAGPFVALVLRGPHGSNAYSRLDERIK